MSKDALTYSREKLKFGGVHGSLLLALGSFHNELISPDTNIIVITEPVGKLRPRGRIKDPYVIQWTLSSQSCSGPQDYGS